MNKKEISAETLAKTLVDCDLSVRALCCCRNAGLHTVADLAACKKTDLLKMRNFGKRTLTELDDFLADLGLEWGTIYVVNEDGSVVKAS